MSEIEKMMQNAGVNKRCHANIKFDDCIYSPSDCGNYNYPDFTAEKQLEIVKMILFSTWWINLKRLQFSEKFDEGLAQMINELWQDLSEEEKEAVCGILRA